MFVPQAINKPLLHPLAFTLFLFAYYLCVNSCVCVCLEKNTVYNNPEVLCRAIAAMA